MDRPGVRQVPGGSGEQRKMEETGREVICGAITAITAKGWVKGMKKVYTCAINEVVRTDR